MKAKYDYLLENHKDTLKMITSINNNTLSLSSTDDSDVYRFMVGDIGLLEKSIET